MLYTVVHTVINNQGKYPGGRNGKAKIICCHKRQL